MVNKKDEMKSKTAEKPKSQKQKLKDLQKPKIRGDPKPMAEKLKKDDKSFQRLKVVPKSVSGPRMISLKRIHSNPYNCNRMDTSEIEALEADMKAMKHPSMLDPLRVRLDGKEFEIIDGEHRFSIANTLKWPEISCTIFDMPQDDALLWNFRINRQRGTHDPTKEANFFKHLKDDLGYTQQQIGELLNVDRSVVSRRISILNIDEDILKDVDLDKTPVSVLEVVAQAPTKELQKELFETYNDSDSTVEYLQEAVNEKKEELAKEKKFNDTLSKAKFPDCPTCGDKATGFYWTKPYVTDSLYNGHVWNPKTGKTKRQDDAQERASDTGHPGQTRIISVFRHQLTPSQIIAKARPNFADFAEVVYNQVSDVKLNFTPEHERGDYDGDFTAKLGTGQWGNPEIHIDSDQGTLQVVLEAKAYGSGEQTKVIVSQPSTYEKGGLEKAEKLLSKLIEGKLTFKKLTKATTKRKKLKLPKPKTGTIQPTDKEMWQLEANEVYKALARFCNHGKSTNFCQEELLCGGYNCTDCLVQDTLEEAGLWGTDAMGDGSNNSKPGEYEYHHHTDEGLPLATKLILMDKFRKLLASAFKTDISTGGSSPVKAQGKKYVIAITQGPAEPAGKKSNSKHGVSVVKEPGAELLRAKAKEKEVHKEIKKKIGSKPITAEERDIGNALVNNKKSSAKDMKKLNDAAIKKGTMDIETAIEKHNEDKMGIEAAIKKEKKLDAEIQKIDDDAFMRRADGHRKCLTYTDCKYCNRCVNTGRMNKKKCYKDPGKFKPTEIPDHEPDKKLVKEMVAEVQEKKKKPRTNSSGVYTAFDETISFSTPDKKAYIDINLVDTGKGWAVGSHDGHLSGSLAGQGSPCSLDRDPFKTRKEALAYAIYGIQENQENILKHRTGSESKLQLSNAKKMLEWLGELRVKENLPKGKQAKKKPAKKEPKTYGLISECPSCKIEFETEKAMRPKCPKCGKVVS